MPVAALQLTLRCQPLPGVLAHRLQHAKQLTVGHRARSFSICSAYHDIHPTTRGYEVIVSAFEQTAATRLWEGIRRAGIKRRRVTVGTHKMGVRTHALPRAALRKGMYVIVTCQRVGSTLQAVTVHIESRHPRPRPKRS